MTDQSIISTKINIPRLRPDVIFRQRIVDKLNDGLTRPTALTLISAPAGYGKTTLLVSWIRKSNHRCAWLSLEPEDDSFPRFITYLSASLQNVDSKSAQTMEMLVDGGKDISSQIDSIISVLINQLSKYKRPVQLVLEDFHNIKSREIHKFIEQIIEHVRVLQLVITTRYNPPLPLPRWRARNQLIELRDRDLQFTIDETTEFIKGVMRLELSGDEISILKHKTEGWAAGLQLAALSIRNHNNDLWKPGGENRHIGDYLLTEVYNQLSPSRRDFLLKTSFVNGLSASLCNAIIQREDSQILLEELEADNLFILSLDDSREWFRYHQLFSEFLRNRFVAEYPENFVQELHTRAAHWFNRNGHSMEAIHHALAGKDYEFAVRLIGPQSQKWMQRGEISTILRYLKRIPDDFVWGKWSLCLWYGWSYAIRGDVNLAQHWTNRLEAIITPLIQEATQKEEGAVPSDLQNAYAQVLGIRSVIARQIKDFGLAITLVEQALRLVHDENLHLKTVLSSLLSSAVLESGSFDQAEDLLHSTRKNAYRTGNAFIAFSLLGHEAILAVMRGQLHRAHELNNEALRFAQIESMEQLAFLPRLRLGRIHYFWNQLAQAQQYINDAIEQADLEKYPDATIRGLITCAWIQNAERQYPQALQTLEQAEQIALTHHALESAEMVRGVRAQLQFSAKEYESVIRWAKSSDWESLESSKSPLILSDESFFPYCQIFIASGELSKWNRVEHLLAWRLTDSEKQKRNSTILKIRLTQASLYQAQGYPDKAMTAILQALEIAAPENYVRPFLDEGRGLVQLLNRVPNVHNNFAKQILASTAKSQSSALIEPLSQREINILKLMAEGHTNPEIARICMLAVSTVRWYARQIFRKLGVHNRTQAATEARKLNLL